MSKVESSEAGKPRKKIIGKHGPKAKLGFRRGVLPPLAGVLVMLTILAAFNGQILFAQIKYHFAESAIAAATTTNGTMVPGNSTATDNKDDTKSPNPELGPRLTIPSINVDAPVIFEKGTAEWQIQTALRSGVVHYGPSKQPGETGNVVIFGHSSGQPWAPGDYKFVFTLLDKLNKDDKIYVDNGGTRYTYTVVRSEVVMPTDVGVLTSADDHELTLITCTPVGTNTKRLIIHAVQTSPTWDKATKSAANDAAAALAQPLPALDAAPQELPSSASLSLWDRIRNLFN